MTKLKQENSKSGSFLETNIYRDKNREPTSCVGFRDVIKFVLICILQDKTRLLIHSNSVTHCVQQELHDIVYKIIEYKYMLKNDIPFLHD